MSTSNPPPLGAPSLAAPAPPAPAASSAAPTFPPPPARHDDDEEDDDEDMGAVPPAAAVRLSVMRRLWAATNELQGLRRLRLAFFGVAGLTQVVAFIVILAGHYSDECDSPLGAYLIMVIVRISFAYPPYFWLTISPPRPPARRDSDDETRAAIDRNRHVGTLAIDHRVRRLSDLVSVYALVLFILGNVWVAGARTCSATAPTLYKGALAALILSWIYIAEVLVWSLLIIFCLPFLLIGMRWFGVGQAKNEVGPLKKEDIASLPQRVFIGTLPEDAPPAPAESASTDAPSSPTASPAPNPAAPATGPSPIRPPHRRQLWRLWRRRAKSPSSSSAGGSSAAQMGDFPPFPSGALPLQLPESQAACAICLCEYDPPPLRGTAEAEGWEPELLGLLPCGHAFHAACLGDWLVVSGRCPLCQRDLHAPKKKRKTRARGGGGGGADGGGANDGAALAPGSPVGAGAPGVPGAEERV
ncbi:hypothetical protein JCM10450v2_003207 [Rhodotorula kratochvilovae]